MITLKKFVPTVVVPPRVQAVKVFKFSELPENVQENLKEKEYYARCEDYDADAEEIAATCQAICDYVGGNASYSWDDERGQKTYIAFDVPNLGGHYYDDMRDLAGSRAVAYLENNIFAGLRVKRHDVIKSYDRRINGRDGLTAWVDGTTPDHALRTRDGRPVYLYSRRDLPLVSRRRGNTEWGVESCPFTGVCWDCYFYDARTKWLDEIRRDPATTVGRFFEILGNLLAQAYDDARDYRLGAGIEEDFNGAGGCGAYISDSGYYLADGTAVDSFTDALPGYQYAGEAV